MLMPTSAPFRFYIGKCVIGMKGLPEKQGACPQAVELSRKLGSAGVGRCIVIFRRGIGQPLELANGLLLTPELPQERV